MNIDKLDHILKRITALEALFNQACDDLHSQVAALIEEEKNEK